MLVGIGVSQAQRREARAYGRLVEVANAEQLRAMVTDVGDFQRKIRSEGVLQTQGPVPNMGRGELTVNSSDGAGTGIDGIAIQSTATEVPIDRPIIPGKGGEHCQVACRDSTASRVPSGGDDGAGRHAGKAEAVVEGQKCFPVDGLEDQSAATAEHGSSVAADIPCKAGAWSEVLVIGVIDTAAYAVPARLYQSGCRAGIKVSQQIVRLHARPFELVPQPEL